MVWRIQYLSDRNVVLVKTQGDIPYEELLKQFSDAVRLAQKNNTNCYLFDDTELHINVSTLDIYDIPKMILATEISRSSRIAVAISPEENRIEDYQFLETVCVNQGLNVKIFSEMDKAYNWLIE